MCCWGHWWKVGGLRAPGEVLPLADTAGGGGGKQGTCPGAGGAVGAKLSHGAHRHLCSLGQTQPWLCEDVGSLERWRMVAQHGVAWLSSTWHGFAAAGHSDPLPPHTRSCLHVPLPKSVPCSSNLLGWGGRGRRGPAVPTPGKVPVGPWCGRACSWTSPYLLWPADLDALWPCDAQVQRLLCTLGRGENVTAGAGVSPLSPPAWA